MDKELCAYRTNKGKRCKNNEVLPSVWFCNRHLDKMYNLKIKKSTIKNAGFGLFCGSRKIREGEIIAEYSRFDIFLEDCERVKDITYLYRTEENNCFDAINTNNLIARYANDGRSDEKNNCEFYEFGGRVFMIATKDIKRGSEIFCDYGENYWD